MVPVPAGDTVHKYIENTLKLLEYTNLKPVRTPINADIDASSPILKPHMLRKFMTAVDCLGWLCNTGRPDKLMLTLESPSIWLLQLNLP